MNSFDLPPELLDVERRLAERARPKPDTAFRRRVLSAMGNERATSRAGRLRQDVWRWAATLAAAVLLSLNLAMSLANHRAGPRAERIEGEDIDSAARALRQRHPDLSEREADQLAALMRTAPALPASLDRIIPLEGEESWDMR
ncbi:MAG TPA: hypothetical protein VH575_19710 [Gemmataceae bacterium]|jgi:hypothetical protein